MKIKVEERHIHDGVRGDSCLCPIALSIRENLKLDYRFRVNVSHPMCLIGDSFFILPSVAQEFIHNYDGNYIGKYGPFEFDLDIPNYVYQTSIG